MTENNKAMVTEACRRSSVRFSINDIRIKDNEILVEEEKEGEFLLHLGFLQHEVKYKVVVPLPKNKFPTEEYEDYSYVEPSPPNPLVTDFLLTHNAENMFLEFEINALTETSLSTALKLSVRRPERIITLRITANVLGTGKGTPLLKNGIHVLEVPPHIQGAQGSSSS